MKNHVKMKSSTFRLVIILAVISITGVTVMQIYWIKKGIQLQKIEFSNQVTKALKTVAVRILKYNDNQSPLIDAIEEVSSNYYIVKVNDKIDQNLLKGLLKKEFLEAGINEDYIYVIYDCFGKQIVSKNFVFQGENPENKLLEMKLPKFTHDNYYFGISFPNKSFGFSSANLWSFSSLLVLIVLIFFGYVLYVVFNQKRLSEIQKDFINNMTHEFKTPITSISLASEVLSNPDIIHHEQRLNSYIAIIKDEASRLQNQVERVLQVARLDKKELEVKKEKMDFLQVVETVVKNYKNQVTDGHIEFKFDVGDPIVWGDTVHLTNMVYNLLDNAVKYSNSTVRIEVTLTELKDGLSLEVNDNGIGISKENLKRIFDKFFRVHVGNLHHVKGFGLGLYYVKRVVTLHKGTVSVTSELGKGSQFSIFLPKKS